jgi:hypothetical protein
MGSWEETPAFSFFMGSESVFLWKAVADPRGFVVPTSLINRLFSFIEFFGMVHPSAWRVFDHVFFGRMGYSPDIAYGLAETTISRLIH